MRAAIQSVTTWMSRPPELALRVLLADLAEELVVVVDLLDVLDLRAVLLLEVVLSADVLLVDVERPVREVHARRDLALRDRLRPRCLAAAAAAGSSVAAAGEVGERATTLSSARPRRASSMPPARSSSVAACMPLELAFQVARYSGVTVVRRSASPCTMWMFSCGPAQPRAVARRRQAPARLLVGVRHEHGHARVVRQPHDHLRGRAQVERALHLALDARPAVAARLAVGASARASRGARPRGARSPALRAAARGVRTVGPASRRSSRRRRRSRPTSPGIRFDTPMKPATKVGARAARRRPRDRRPARSRRGSSPRCGPTS